MNLAVVEESVAAFWESGRGVLLAFSSGRAVFVQSREPWASAQLQGPVLLWKEGVEREVGDRVKCGAWPHASSFLSRTPGAQKPTPPLFAQDPHPHLTSVI